MSYQIVPLGAQGQFELNGVRFNGKSFMYWKRKSTMSIREIVILFDKKYENIEVKDGILVLSLKGLTNYQDLSDAIRILFQILSVSQIQVRFIVENDNQRQMAEALGHELGIIYKVVMVGIENKENVARVENRLQNSQNYTASGSKTIEVQKNMGIEKVTVSDNRAYVNRGTLSIDEQKFALLQEWKKDPYMNSKLVTMSAAEIDRMLMDNVTNNLTTYRMESASEQLADDKVGEVAMNKATNEDGLVNTRLGIVENNVSNSNQYSTVEERGESVRVVNAAVTSSKINSGGVTGDSTSSNDSSSMYVDTNFEENVEQSRKVISEFYIDDEYNVYDDNENVIGRVGQAGLLVDYNSNTLVKNGQVMGYIGDYNDMGKNNGDVKSKNNVKVLKKKDEYKSAGIVSLPVIMFILSFMLLIASIVLLFVLD